MSCSRAVRPWRRRSCAPDVVDAVRWYVAPALLGAGAPALGEAGMSTISEALRLQVIDVARVGADVRIDARVTRAAEED